ncbi:MAG: helix-turn-helix transcriptional regulator [Solibacillus sp.]
MKRQWLKKIRTDANMTQGDVAKIVPIATSTYAMYEQGRRTPSVKIASEIGFQLGFDWKLFFETELHESCNKKLA